MLRGALHELHVHVHVQSFRLWTARCATHAQSLSLCTNQKARYWAEACTHAHKHFTSNCACSLDAPALLWRVYISRLPVCWVHDRALSRDSKNRGLITKPSQLVRIEEIAPPAPEQLQELYMVLTAGHSALHSLLFCHRFVFLRRAVLLLPTTASPRCRGYQVAAEHLVQVFKLLV
jgi:hypothetical protein